MSRLRGDWAWAILLLVALLAASAQKSFWGAHGESRRAEVSREVLEDGQWLVPTLLGEPFLTKPPLLYWCGAAGMALFGVSEWAVRLPSLLAALLSWFAMLSLARSYHGELSLQRGPPRLPPESAALSLLGLPLFLAMSLNAETEPLLLACGLWAVAAYLRLAPRRESGGAPWRLLPTALALGLGFLVKGPLGWIFPLLGLLAFESGLPTSRRRLGPWDWPLLLLLQLPLVLPWFLLVLARHPEAWGIWLGESVARVADADFQVHREAWWYYLPRLAVFLPALLWLGRGSWRERTGRIPLVWLGLGLLFLSLAASKRTHYLLSLAPAAALLPLTAESSPDWERLRGRLWNVLPWLPALIFPGALATLFATGRLPLWTGAASALLAGGILLWLWRRAGRRDPLQRWSLVLLLVLWGGSLALLPAVDAYRSPRAFYREAGGLIRDGQPVVNWRNDRYSASFHLRRIVWNARSEQELARLLPSGGWLLCQEGDAEPLARAHRTVLRRELVDPFQSGHRRTWLLIQLAPLPAATRLDPQF